MSALPAIEQQQQKVILEVIEDELSNKHNQVESIGGIKRIHSNKVAGKNSEVYAFRTEEEIKAMIDIFDKRIADTPDEEKEKITCRNKLLYRFKGIRFKSIKMLFLF